MPGNDGTLLMEGAEIQFRNFAGREGMFNAEGDRNFCVFLDEDLAQRLDQDGWNVKQLKVREDGDIPQKYLQVSVKYRGRNDVKVRPPTIVLITSKGRTSLSEDECEILDYVDIANTDLIIRPYEWAVSGKHGIKAYLKSLYITIHEDALQRKYEDLPELGGGSQTLAIESGKSDDVVDAESYIPGDGDAPEWTV